MQELIIGLIFLVALGYLGRRIYRSLDTRQAGCGKGCGCAADSRTPTVAPLRKTR